jgi:hypothetical protein
LSSNIFSKRGPSQFQLRVFNQSNKGNHLDAAEALGFSDGMLIMSSARFSLVGRTLTKGGASNSKAALVFAMALWIQFLTCGLIRADQNPAPVSFPQGVRVFDLDGNSVNPFASATSNGIVFIFVSVECPISNAYMPEYRRLADEFAPKGVAFRLVFPNPDESGEAIRKHLEAFKCSIAALRDPQHELVKVAEARVTPEAAFFASDRGLVYHGRIDDRNVELGRARPSATQHDLREAIQAILKGRLPEVRATRAVGCYIAEVP